MAKNTRKLKSTVPKSNENIQAAPPAPKQSLSAAPVTASLTPKPSVPAATAAAPAAPKQIAPIPLTQPSAPAPVKSAPAPTAPVSVKQSRVSLEFLRPGAKSVCVAGSFNGWKPESTPLVQAGNGRWVGDLTIKPGRHEYLFVVDGQWLPDPNAQESVQNPFGGRNSVLMVSE